MEPVLLEGGMAAATSNPEIALRAHMEPVLLEGGMAAATTSPVNIRLQKFSA